MSDRSTELAIAIDRLAGLATVQDLGRPGRMHEGLAPGGALVPSLLARANRAVGNADGAPAIEVFGRIAVRAEADLVIAASSRVWARAGEVVALESEPRRVAYLAVPGGIATPTVLGGCGTQLSAGIGARLQRGNRLAVGPVAPRERPVEEGSLADLDRDGPISVLAGPDIVPGALDALIAGTFQISPASDRVGTRLAGTTIAVVPRPIGPSRPLVRGAIELPPDGTPIVLGPEHPTTGGYPVIAVVASADQDRLFARRVGGRVRFTVASPRARE